MHSHQIRFSYMSDENKHKPLYKRLRMIKKCKFCQHSLCKQDIIRSNVKQHCSYLNSFQLACFTHRLSQMGGDISICSENNDATTTIAKRYNLWSSLSELGGLAYYYRFYRYIPACPKQTPFNIVFHNKSRKKIMEYNKIWMMYKKDLSQNTSNTNKKNIIESQMFLKGLINSQSDLSEEALLLKERLQITNQLIQLSQIDTMYHFIINKNHHTSNGETNIKRSTKKYKNNHKGQSIVASPKKKIRNHKSCESLAKYQYKYQQTQVIRADRQSVSSIKKRKSLHCLENKKVKKNTHSKLEKAKFSKPKQKIKIKTQSNLMSKCSYEDFESLKTQKRKKKKEKLDDEMVRIKDKVEWTMWKHLGLKKKKGNRMHMNSCASMI